MEREEDARLRVGVIEVALYVRVGMVHARFVHARFVHESISQ